MDALDVLHLNSPLCKTRICVGFACRVADPKKRCGEDERGGVPMQKNMGELSACDGLLRYDSARQPRLMMHGSARGMTMECLRLQWGIWHT